ncbi:MULTISPECIES: nucleoside triphosphate pyrophosphohydrolase family protein [unclassified Bradyrhizobium]|uniref:nucleoside triphosphate pyrophosphohydrolase family protein n=1 Tax=unclassified Bradyrhizobium TaxID=2631580 RepID=UPI0028EC637E|nr:MULTISPECIES: nucleoside triphosphate pyrophosphohydrolase family protein [unclassified Bradyrhizobium]
METSAMGLNEYQLRASETDRFAEKGPTLPTLGLVGEIGSLLSEVKKKQRDTAAYVNYESAVLEELGDTLWYLATIARIYDIPLASLFDEAQAGVKTGDDVRFSSLQPQHVLRLNTPAAQFERTLLNLAAAGGTLAGGIVGGSHETSRQAIATQLRRIFDLLILASDEASVTLEAAASISLTKANDRWPRERIYPALFDDVFPEEERLPRSLSIDIYEREAANGKRYVLQRCNDLFIGDRLTDNIMLPDDYRFHDVFHYAYAAVLGWSPVMRALLRRKRKSETRVDEGEDGARAVLIEEGVASYVFGVAKDFDFFDGQKPGDLSFTFLKNVRQFVRGYEVDRLPLWLWEEAILQGNKAFRFLRIHRRGTLHVDLIKRSMTIEGLST